MLAFADTTATASNFSIEPLGGYSLKESAGFIDAWHEAPSEGDQTEGHLHLAYLTDAGWTPVGVCLTQDTDGRVRGTIHGDESEETVRRQTSRILSLDVD